MADRIAADFDAIGRHAARVEAVASDIGVAREAAASMNMGGGAFGIMCSFLVGPATLASSLAQNAIGSAEKLVTRSAREIRGVADDFVALEESIAAKARALEADVDEVDIR